MATLTFAILQTVVNRRAGPYAALADVHESTYYALVAMGYSPASPILVSDVDLAPVPIEQFPKLFDVTAWRMAETAASNCTDLELKKIGVEQNPERARLQLRERAECQFRFVSKAYGIGLPTLQVGVVDSAFQQQDTTGQIDFGG